ncbi:MAG: GlsB/YeaQ/YmgE family stress response membrane protein [Trueperaceae bacterium]
MNFLLWLLMGAVAGWIASLIMKTNRSQGTLVDIVVGIVGAFLGGWLFETFGQAGVTGFNFYSLLVAVVGAVVLLFLVRLVRR